MLTDPRAALAEQNTVATALTGLAGLARLVQALAAAGRVTGPPERADDLVHVLLGIASLGEGVTRLVEPVPPDPAPPAAPREWLR
ncbi:MAG: hypothetical protein ACRDTH_13820 [Pseudonocardiaceae bacterium]